MTGSVCLNSVSVSFAKALEPKVTATPILTASTGITAAPRINGRSNLFVLSSKETTIFANQTMSAR